MASAADPIPESSNARGPYQMRLFKAGPRIRFSINNIDILEWLDDGDEHGPALEGGKIGFRQMAPLIAEYGNFRVYSLK